MAGPKKYYAVAQGRTPGIYTSWFGPSGAEAQVRGVAGARFKGFPTLKEARAWMENPIGGTGRQRKKKPSAGAKEPAGPRDGEIIIHTDGGCRGNPGPGGYGAVIVDGAERKELSRGFRRTTNNRMELLACIVALESLEKPSDVLLHSDSQYVVNGISKGWARRWREKNWMRTKDDPALNTDLWARLLSACERHSVRFVWVRGHAGNEENERCDTLATTAAAGKNLAKDTAYEKSKTSGPEAAQGPSTL